MHAVQSRSAVTQSRSHAVQSRSHAVTQSRSHAVQSRSAVTQCSHAAVHSTLDMATPHGHYRQLTLLEFFKRIDEKNRQLALVDTFDRAARIQEPHPVTTNETPVEQVFSIPEPLNDSVHDSSYERIEVRRRLFAEEHRGSADKRPRDTFSSSSSNDTNMRGRKNPDCAEFRRRMTREESRLFRIEGYLSRIESEKEMWLQRERRVKRAIKRLKREFQCSDDSEGHEGPARSRRRVREEYDFETEILDDTAESES